MTDILEFNPLGAKGVHAQSKQIGPEMVLSPSSHSWIKIEECKIAAKGARLHEMEYRRFIEIKQWYKFYKPILCWVGIHEWIEVKYRKQDRTLIAWEECCILSKS